MKTGYFISALATLCALAIGCTKMTVGGDLAEVQLSQSTVALPAKGGSAKIDVNATGEWTINALTDAEAKWLAVDKMSGPAGTTTVTFTALAESAACNKTTLILKCAGAEQHIYVQQGVPTVSEVTCKEVNEGPKGATYRVTGICTAIAESATYGNWYITDDESDPLGTVYIYGTKYNGQTKQGAIGKYNIEVGDQVTIEGPKDVYNGTVELVDVDVIKVVKSLIKIADASNEYKAGKEAGTLDVKLIVKGDDFNFSVEDDWLSVKNISTIKASKKADPDTTVVTLAYLANEDDVRYGFVDFSSSANGQTSTALATIEQASGLSCYALPYDELFDKSQGAWTIEDVVLPEGVDYVWSWGGASYGMKASGYVNKVNYETESDLVSPRIDLTGKTAAKLQFDHVQRYGVNVFEELTLWISNDSGETWKEILIPEYTAGKNWDFITTSVSLTPYCGAQVQVKFKYKSHTTGGATWEIKNIHVTEGEVEIGNIAQLNSIATSAEKEWSGSFKDAQVKYVNGSNVFIEDESAGTQLYLRDSGLAAGKVINGEVSGKIKLYNGYAELTALDFSKATVTEAPVEFSEMELADLLKSYLRFQNCMVKLPGVTIASTMSSSSRTVEVSKDDAKINAYLQDKNVTVEAGTGDLTCFPTRYNANLQLGVWTPDHFVK